MIAFLDLLRHPWSVFRLRILLLVAFYLFGFVQMSFGTSLVGPVAKIEVTHTHTHDHSDHHSPSHDSNSEKETSRSHGTVPHAHEINLGSPAFYVGSVYEPSFVFRDEGNQNYLIVSAGAPQAPFLVGIFRPPIV